MGIFGDPRAEENPMGRTGLFGYFLGMRARLIGVHGLSLIGIFGIDLGEIGP